MVGQFLELVYLHEKVIHIFDALIHQSVLRTFDRQQVESHGCVIYLDLAAKDILVQLLLILVTG